MYKKDTDIREFFTIKEKENQKQINNIKHIASFSDKQQYVFEKYKNGDNIFITGSGGCGKSYLIHKIYKDAIENRKNIHITAMTGCAAILLDCNATTINTWGSLGICEDDFEKIIKKIRMYKSDGVEISKKYDNLYEVKQSEMPADIQTMIDNNEIGAALLRIIEVIGPDKIENIDEDTVYFIINTLNQLNVDLIRNKLLLKVLPLKV